MQICRYVNESKIYDAYRTKPQTSNGRNYNSTQNDKLQMIMTEAWNSTSYTKLHYKKNWESAEKKKPTAKKITEMQIMITKGATNTMMIS